MSDLKKYLILLFAALILLFSAWKAVGVLGKVGKTIVERSVSNTGDYSTQELRNFVLPNSFESIDQHARNAPSEVEKSIKGLANYLAQNTQSDIEKARAIYVWLAENISYNDEAYNVKDYSGNSAQAVFKNRKAVCGGFSNLYKALGNEMGLEIKKVSGYSKGFGYKIGDKMTTTDHAWNVIKIDGKWRVFDATWGEGYGKNIDGKLKSTKKFNDYWFNVDPYETIFNHYPENLEYLLVKPLLSLSEYEQLPKVSGSYFALGFNGKETYDLLRSNPNLETPSMYKVAIHIEKIDAPKLKDLHKNQSYRFEFYAPNAYKMALIDGDNNWTYFKESNGRFYIDFTPKRTGVLRVSVKEKRNERSFSGLMAYKVQKGSMPI